MKQRRARITGLVACLAAAGAALTYGCSSNSGGLLASDDTPGPGGGDAASASDVAIGDSAPAPPVAPPHLIFLTAATFTGDLISAANDEGDGGGDAGDAGAKDSGPNITSYREAANALCERAAASAGKVGTFVAIIQANGDDAFAGIKDSDGPWALADGTPVANTQLELKQGLWHASIDQTAAGVVRTDAGDNGQNRVWTLGTSGVDCNIYSSGTNAHGSYVGSFSLVGEQALNGGSVTCDNKSALFCAQVGDGAGPNVFPAVPAGAKIAFTAPGPYPGNFAVSDAGLVDASVGGADGGADVHLVGDEICNEMAKGNGLSGKFHAWVSSTNESATNYFSGLSMNGPWVRVDGIPVAASLNDLTAAGTQTQLAFGPDGMFLQNLGARVWSGTNSDGGLSTNANCSNFATVSAASSSRNGRSSYKSTDFASRDTDQCSLTAGLYCFEE